MGITVSRWLSAIDGLGDVAARLREVQLENLHAVDVMVRYDSESTLHYVDPPYLMSTRSGGVGYANELTESDHLTLLDCLKRLRGKVVLSGYDSDLYNKELSGWEVLVRPFHNCAAARPFDNKERQEILWVKR